MKCGERNSITDIEGLRVGNAEDERFGTGVTVLFGEAPLTAAVDVRGGGPGTRETDALSLSTLVDQVDALVLSGGSVYGLAAADAVCRQLGAEGKGFSLVEKEGVPRTPIVPAAILYDLANSADKNWGTEPPYDVLGQRALEAGSADFTLGRAGAGFGATAGAYAGGLGTASFETRGDCTVGALAAVNAFGSPYIPATDCFWAAPFELHGEFGGRACPPSPSSFGLPLDSKIGSGARESTTLAIVATDADLTPAELQRVATMAHDGLARALRPAHGPTDGDIVFAVSTRQQQVSSRLLTVMEIGNAAADTLARAIARGVYEAEDR